LLHPGFLLNNNLLLKARQKRKDNIKFLFLIISGKSTATSTTMETSATTACCHAAIRSAATLYTISSTEGRYSRATAAARSEQTNNSVVEIFT
jgi:hypothetical protein